MANRSIFIRKYTSFDSGGTSVFLVNGGGVTTTLPSTQDFIAGETLIQGDFVYVSGTNVFKASALSGLAAFNYNVIGATAEAAAASATVAVNLDGTATLSSPNIVGESALTPGQFYFLSKYDGQVTRYNTTSGEVSNSGTFQHQVLAPVGMAVSTTEFEVEVQPVTILYD